MMRQFIGASSEVCLRRLFCAAMAGCLCLLPCAAYCATWAPATMVSLDDDWSDSGVRIDVDNDGVAWVVWHGRDHAQGDLEVYFSRCISGTWETPARLHQDNRVDDTFPMISIGKDGVPWVVWKSGYDFRNWDLVASRWLGAGWSEPDTLANGLYIISDCEIQARDSSEVWVVWRMLETEPPYDWEAYARRFYLDHWEEAHQFDRPDFHDYSPSVAIDPDGAPWVSWGSGPTKAGLPKIVFSREEGGWTEPAVVDPDSSAGIYSKIASARDGSMWVFWESSSNGPNDDVLFTRWGASGWDTVSSVNEKDEGANADDIRKSIYAGERSWPVAVWNAVLRPGGPPYLDVRCAAWDGQGWTSEEIVCTYQEPEYGEDEFPDVAVGPDGRVWVAWRKRDGPPDYDFDVFVSYSDDALPVVIHPCSLQAIRDGIELSWSAFGYGDLGAFDVYRAEAGVVGMSASRVIPDYAELVNRETLAGASQMTYVDSSVVAGTEYCYWLKHIGATGVTRSFWCGSQLAPSVGYRSTITDVYPTPSSQGVYVNFELAQEAAVSFRIFDASGRLVKSFDLGRMPRGNYSGDRALYWDGREEGGGTLPSGVYFVRMAIEAKPVAESKIVLVR